MVMALANMSVMLTDKLVAVLCCGNGDGNGSDHACCFILVVASLL